MRINFNAVQYSRNRIKEVLHQIERVLEQLTTKPGLLVRDTTLITSGIMEILPNPSSPLDDTWNGPIYSFLSKWAAEKPDAPLIVHNDTVYTYKEVEEQSNRLANYLRQAGIETGERVYQQHEDRKSVVLLVNDHLPTT